jgi:hypothetical protein
MEQETGVDLLWAWGAWGEKLANAGRLSTVFILHQEVAGFGWKRGRFVKLVMNIW